MIPDRLVDYLIQNIFSYGMPAAHRFIVLIGVADIIHIAFACVGHRLSDGRSAAVAAINAAGIYRYGYISRTESDWRLKKETLFLAGKSFKNA